jgi:hypothetical protein
VCLVHISSQKSQSALDDDFEAFKALAKTSLHATVAVTIPGRRNPNGSLSEPFAPETAHSGMVSPATKSPLVQLPSTRVTDTPRPRKKRKVAFNGDLVASPAPQPSQQLALKDVRPSSPHEGPPLSGPTMLRPASQVKSLEADPAETSHKKRKRRNSAPFGKESSPEHGASNHGDVIVPPSPRDGTTPSRMRTGMMILPLLRCSQCTGNGERSRILPASRATGDAGTEATKSDAAKRAKKTGKQKIGPVDAGELSSHATLFAVMLYPKMG